MRSMVFKRDLMEALRAQDHKQGYATAVGEGGSDLLSNLYDVTGAPQNWQRFLRHVTPLLHGSAAAIGTYAAGDEGDRVHALYLPDAEQASATVLGFDDMLRQAACANNVSRCVLPLGILQQLSTLEAPGMTTIALQQPCLFQELGFTEALVGLCSQHDGVLSYLAVARRGEPPFSMIDELELQQFLPHVARSLHLHRLIERLSAGVNTAVTVLDRLPIGIIFFDDQATCLSMNESARRSINDARYLLRHMQSHILSRSKAGPDLSAAKIPQVLTLPPNLGEQHYFLVTWDILAEGQNSLHTVFFILNPDQKIQIDGQALCRLFRLTASEAKVASLIANGAHLDDVAEQLDISLNTVRTHLRHIFEKTGVERQADLIHLLLRALVAIRTPQN
jgi:DNA-binding CsgD family transcriptional regulator/PAS domain-containing protein